MATNTQDRRFLDEVIGSGLLDSAIEWIKDNLDPEDVFPRSDLEHWANMNDYIIPSDDSDD